MRWLVLFALLLPGSAAIADEPGYALALDAEIRGGMLSIAPTISAPAGKQLRYDVATRRTGRSGNSHSRQGGNVTIGADGRAPLSQVNISLGEQDRYEVTVQVYEGARLVASQTLKHPQ